MISFNFHSVYEKESAAGLDEAVRHSVAGRLRQHLHGVRSYLRPWREAVSGSESRGGILHAGAVLSDSVPDHSGGRRPAERRQKREKINRENGFCEEREKKEIQKKEI